MMNFLFEKFLNLYTFMSENFNGHLKTKSLLICQFIILSSNHLSNSLLEYIFGLFNIKNFVFRHFSKTVQILVSRNLHVLSCITQIINIFNNINQLQLIIRKHISFRIVNFTFLGIDSRSHAIQDVP